MGLWLGMHSFNFLSYKVSKFRQWTVPDSKNSARVRNLARIKSNIKRRYSSFSLTLTFQTLWVLSGAFGNQGQEKKALLAAKAE